MSDPVTNAEIEDVLSSIRRLVSEEPLSARARTDSKKPDDDKFVLTPAFRVLEDPASHAADGEADGDADARHQVADQDADEPDAEDARGNAEAADDGGEVSYADHAHEEDDGNPPDAETSVTGEEHTARDDVHVLTSDHAVDRSDDAEREKPWTAAEEMDIDLGELAVAEPDEDGSAALSDPRAGAEDGDMALDPGAEPDDETQDATLRTNPSLTLEQRIAELEAAIEQAPGEWEPDGSEDGTSDETTPIGTDGAAGMARLDGPSTVDDGAEPDAAEQMSSDGPEIAEAGQAPRFDDPATERGLSSESDLAQEPEAIEDAPAEDQAEAAELEDERTETDPAQDWIDAEQSDDHLDAGADLDSEGDLPADTATQVFGNEPEEAQETESAASPKHDDDAQSAADPEADEDANKHDVAADAPEAQAEDDDNIYEADFVDREETAPEPADDAEEATTADDPPIDFYADDSLMDEEALRDMVSNIVRGELQGVLGERITRNVRRLVRREIQRALAVKEFE